jgi:hypothetical protein
MDIGGLELFVALVGVEGSVFEMASDLGHVTVRIPS